MAVVSPFSAPTANDQASAAPAAGDAAFRVQPHNIDAEQELLGAILVNNDAAMKVSGFLQPPHFFHEAHRRISEASLTLIERDEIANPLPLNAYFDRDALLATAARPPPPPPPAPPPP